MPTGVNNNLIPVTERSPEEQRAISSKAGKASSQARRRRKAFKEAIIDAMSAKMPDGVIDAETEAVINAMLKKGEMPNLQDAMIAALFKIAISGEPRAVEAQKLILAQAGEDAPDKQEIVVKVDSSAGDIMG